MSDTEFVSVLSKRILISCDLILVACQNVQHMYSEIEFASLYKTIRVDDGVRVVFRLF